jgi:hypothetical protein
MSNNDEKPDVTAFPVNQNLPTLFADNLTMTTREDGFALLRFYVSLPEGFTEQGRFMVHQTRLEAMMDLMSSLSNYYPVKAKPNKKKSP